MTYRFLFVMLDIRMTFWHAMHTVGKRIGERQMQRIRAKRAKIKADARELFLDSIERRDVATLRCLLVMRGNPRIYKDWSDDAVLGAARDAVRA